MQDFNSMILKMKLLNLESYNVPCTNYSLVKVFNRFFVRVLSVGSTRKYYDIDICELDDLDKSEGLHYYIVRDIAYICDDNENIVSLFSGLHFDVEVYYDDTFIYFFDIFNDLVVLDINDNSKKWSFSNLDRKVYCRYDNNGEIILGGN